MINGMNVIGFCLVIYLLSVAACWHLYYNTDRDELDYGVIYCPFFNTTFPLVYCIFVIWDELELLFKRNGHYKHDTRPALPPLQDDAGAEIDQSRPPKDLLPASPRGTESQGAGTLSQKESNYLTD